MKGIIIHGDPIWGNNERATYCEFINNASYELTQYAPKTIISSLKGESSETSKSVCSEDDTYDFETGALIALMKMCGLEKSAKAYAGIFDGTAYGNALIERDKLKEKADALYAYNKGLKDENKSLNASICAKEVLNKKLLKDYNAAQSAYEIMVEKSADLMDEVKKLEEENEKLKLDCEKLQHGYVDTDMIFCGGKIDAFKDWQDYSLFNTRQNGKQYTALVNLFRKLPQDKIEAAYKEVYNTELPVWKKEFLNQMYGIYKESREKAELPTTLDINGTTYRKEISLKDLYTASAPTEFTWELKVPTKREKMWDYILKEGRTPVYVERKDVLDFLKECQIAGIKWQTGKMPLETVPFNMSEGNDGMYFFVMTSLDITKSTSGTKEFRHVMSWWMTASDEETRNSIKYLPPMRWDLFKKGRKIIRVTPENFGEAMAHIRANVNLESVIKNNFNKSHAFIRISTILEGTDRGIIEFMWPEDLVKKQLADPTVYSSNKIVDWEDVK